MTQNCFENDKLKEWREVKIIENERICKNLVSQSWFIVPFLLTSTFFIFDFCFKKVTKFEKE